MCRDYQELFEFENIDLSVKTYNSKCENIFNEDYEISDDTLYRREYITDSISSYKTVRIIPIITKDEFLLCYETWVKEAKDGRDKSV